MQGVNLGSIFADIRLDTSGLTVGVQHAKREIASLAQNASKSADQVIAIGTRMSMQFTAPIVAGMGLAAREFMGFERSMRNVNSISNMTESELSAVTGEVKDLATELGRMPQDLAAGLYDIASSGFQGAAGLEVLEASAEGATAGLATTKEAAASLTTVLNAYAMDVSKVGQVSDVMFRAVDIGVVTFAELGENLGQVVATAAAAGVPFEQVAAGFATMTKGGINAAETSTALNRVILAFLNPSKKLTEALKASGYESGAAVIQARGLAGAVEYLQEVTGGSAEELAQLGMDARALKAALSLARDEGRVFASDLEAMNNAAGATQAALAEQSKALSFQWDQMKASAAVLAGEIGEALAPSLRAGVDAVKGATEWLRQMSPEMKKAAVAVAAVVASIGPLLVMAGTLTKVVATAKIGWSAIAAVMGGPVVWGTVAAAAALYGLVRIVQSLRKDTEAETKAAQESAKVKRDQADQVTKLVKEHDELAKKTKRTKEESEKLQSILNQIADLNPELIDGYDKHGNALKLVADYYRDVAAAAREAHREEARTLLSGVASRISKEQADRDKLSRDQQKLGEQIASGKRTEVYAYGGAVNVRTVKLTEEGKNKLRAEQRDLESQIAEHNRNLTGLEEERQSILASLRGEAPPKADKKTDTTKTTTSTTSGAAGGVSERKKTPTELADEAAAGAMQWMQNMVALGRMTDAEHEAGLTKIIDREEQYAQISLNTEARAFQERSRMRQAALRKDEQSAEERKRAEERAASETARIEQANQDALIDLYRAMDLERQAVEEQRKRRIQDQLAQGVDIALAVVTANKEADQAIAALEERRAEDEERAAAERLRSEMQVLDFELQHNIITTDAYIAALQTRLDATKRYSDEWFDIHNRMEDAHADSADEIVRQTESMARKNRDAAIASILLWIDHYASLGEVGVAAVEKLSAALTKLSVEQKRVADDWRESYRQTLGAIRTDFVDTVVGMIEGTKSFTDFVKSALHDALRFIVNELVQVAIESDKVWTTVGSGIKKYFSDVIELMKSEIATAIAGIYGLYNIAQSQDKKRRKGGLLGGILGAAAGFALGGPAGSWQGFQWGSAIGGAAASGGFDNPINDTAAVRSGADFGRLFSQGLDSTLGRAWPTRTVEPRPGGPTIINNNPTITVTTNVDKVTGIDDIERVSEAQAWIISQRLRLVPTGT